MDMHTMFKTQQNSITPIAKDLFKFIQLFISFILLASMPTSGKSIQFGNHVALALHCWNASKSRSGLRIWDQGHNDGMMCSNSKWSKLWRRMYSVGLTRQ